jgi:hypothetical protein
MVGWRNGSSDLRASVAKNDVYLGGRVYVTACRFSDLPATKFATKNPR